MNRPNTYSILKISCWLFLFMGLFFSYSPSASAVTTNRHSLSTPQLIRTAGEIQRQAEPIYLLDWQENRMVTTAGVFILNDNIEIIDRYNMRETFSLQQNKRHKSRKLHRVIIKKDGRRIIRITIE